MLATLGSSARGWMNAAGTRMATMGRWEKRSVTAAPNGA